MYFRLHSETASNSRNIVNPRPLGKEVTFRVKPRDFQWEVYGNSFLAA
jgi:hypothetical protein